MFIKLVFKYFSFYFMHGCVALSCVSFMTHAATISITEKASTTSFSSPQSTLITKPSPAQIQNTPPDNKVSTTITSDSQPTDTSVMHLTNTQPTHQAPNTLTQSDYYKYIKKTGIGFLDENGDSEFLIDSLIALSNAKQFFNETEAIINNQAQDLLFSLELELDHYLQIELLFLQQESIPGSFSVRFKEINSNDIVTYEQSVTTAVLLNYEETDDSILAPFNFLRKIFRITTLAYLVVLLISYSILKGAIKILLFRKFHPK